MQGRLDDSSVMAVEAGCHGRVELEWLEWQEWVLDVWKRVEAIRGKTSRAVRVFSVDLFLIVFSA